MKNKIITVALAFSSFAAIASSNQNNNTVPVNVSGDVGTLHVSQCGSVFGNCNNASMEVNLNGDVQTVYVDGKATVVKGADGRDGVDGRDGKDGLDGADGKDGAQGIQGERGETGAAGADGRDGKDGVNGIDGKDGAQGVAGERGDKGDKGDDGKDGQNGKDADMSLVNANTQAIATETEERKAGDVSAQLRIDQANANIEANRQASAATNKRVAENTAAIANHEQRITSLEQQTVRGFSDLKRQIDDNRKDANAGIAGVSAMANIPQVTASQDFSVGAGVGFRGDEQAIAVGFSARAYQNVVVKASVAGDTQQSLTVGAGVSYGW